VSPFDGYDAALCDGIMRKRVPALAGCPHRTRCAPGQPERMIGVRMCEHDRVRTEPTDSAEPISAAIEQHASPTGGHEECRVPTVPARTRLDLAARPQKCEFDRVLPGAGTGTTKQDKASASAASSVRDASANNLAEVLDHFSPPRAAPP
jgi:hypothetical protein